MSAIEPRVRITSRANELVKFVRSLQQRKARDASGRYTAEGLYFLIEAAANGIDIETILFTAEAARHVAARDILAGYQGRADLVETTPEVMASLSRRDNPQGLVLVLRQQWSELPGQPLAAGDLWVALQGARDPGNLGTIVRTGHAVGAAGIILLGESCDPYSVEAVRASMGSIFALRFCRGDLAAFTAWRAAAAAAAAVVGTSLRARLDYRAEAYPLPLVLLMGNEQSGLPPAYQALCDRLVKIPMRGGVDSLNLAVATSVLLYEVFNQNRTPGAVRP